MNLNDFEQHVNEIIRKRGAEYYRNGRVAALDRDGKGSYHAIVEGTEEYNVNIRADEAGNISGIECDCPYDMGLICKHAVAVLYAIRSENSGEKKQAGSGTQKKHAREAGGGTVRVSASPEERLPEILSGLSKDELVRIILGLTLEDEGLASKLAFQYCGELMGDEVVSCRNLIRRGILSYKQRYGYVPYEHTYEALEGTEQVLQRAELLVEKEDYLRAVELYLCVIRELADLYQELDDSDGYAGSMVERAVGGIQVISTMDLGEDTSRLMFGKLIKEARHEALDDWADRRLDIIDACVSLSSDNEQKVLLMDYLQQLEDKLGKDSYNRYYIEQIVLLKYQILLRHGSDAEAAEFFRQNTAFPKFREMAIQSALSGGDFEEAERLAREGESLNAGLPGLVKQWQKYRYAAYERSGQLDLQRELAKQLIMADEYEYYDKLKKTYEKSQWAAVYQKILEAFEERKHWSRCYLEILIEEKEYKRLLGYVRGNPSSIREYYKYLLKDYQGEVYEIYGSYILQQADWASDRKGYQRVCNLIRHLIKIGGTNKGSGLISALLDKYPRKPAFKEELMKIYSVKS